MDCSTARMLATFFGRQGSELAPEDAADLNVHLAGCPSCANAVRFERDFDARLGKRMLAVPIPSNLKSKILDGIAAERGAWYRKKFYAATGLAATILIAIGGVIAWQMGNAPELTLSEIARQADQREQDRPRNAREFLADQGIEFHPERALDLNQAETWGMHQLQGKFVPTLYLVNRPKNASATVYVVRDRDFKWKNLPQDGSSVQSVYGFQVAVLRDQKRSDVGYVVVFIGAGLEVFLDDRPNYYALSNLRSLALNTAEPDAQREGDVELSEAQSFRTKSAGTTGPASPSRCASGSAGFHNPGAAI